MVFFEFYIIFFGYKIFDLLLTFSAVCYKICTMKLPKFEYLYCYYHDKNTVVKPHYHNCYELTYFCDGNSLSEMNGESYKCFAGNFLIYPSGCVHDERHLSKVKVLCLGFTPAESDSAHSFQALFSDHDKSVLRLLEQIQNETLDKQENFHFMCSLLTGQLLVSLLRQTESPFSQSSLSPVLRYINEHYTFDIELEYLAKLSGYSYDHFRHAFKQKTGLTPLNYILNKKIDHAKLLLKNSSIRIADIAITCGFANISQFSVTFKKMTGRSPSEYRNNQ